MNLKTIKTLAITSAVVAGVAAFGSTAIHAAPNTNATTRPNPMANLITTLSQKFNLNQADVQKIFDEQHAQMQQEKDAKHTEALKTRLAQAVKDGKLTQAQADLITTKQAEFKTFMESLRDKTETERQTAMKTKMDELKQWATTNGIPEQFAHIGPMGGHGGGRGPGGPNGAKGPGGRGMMMRGGR